MLSRCCSLEQEISETVQKIGFPIITVQRKRAAFSKTDQTLPPEHYIDNKLPEDVLAECWSWLDITDLLTGIAWTSKRWVNILKNIPSAWQSCTLRIVYSLHAGNRKVQIKLDEIIQSNSSLLRNIPNVVLNMVPHENTLTILHVLPQLKTLECSSITEAVVREISLLVHLERLKIRCTSLDIVFKYPLSQLLYLTIEKKHQDECISLQISQFANLQTLCLIGSWSDSQIEHLFDLSISSTTNRIKKLQLKEFTSNLTPSCLSIIRKYSSIWSSLRFDILDPLSKLTLTNVIEKLLLYCDTEKLIEFEYSNHRLKADPYNISLGNRYAPKVQLMSSQLQRLSLFTNLESLTISIPQDEYLPVDVFQDLCNSLQHISHVSLHGSFKLNHLYALRSCPKLKRIQFISGKNHSIGGYSIVKLMTDEDGFFDNEKASRSRYGILSRLLPLKNHYGNNIIYDSRLLFFYWLQTLIETYEKQDRKRNNYSLQEMNDFDTA